MEKNRLEAFSDGVLAIIITIMVLELKVPHGDSLADLKEKLPVFLSYVLSFIYVGIYWNNHHHLLKAVHKVNGAMMWANMHLLFWLSLFPFTTDWMGKSHLDPTPTAVYGFVLLMAAIAYYILQRAIIAQQGFFHFRKFGADSYVVDMVGILVLRELGVLIVCIMVAGRSGSAYTAELGSMKMREEIDALRTMGFDPIEVLVLPRVLALIIGVPILTFLGSMAALYGGGLVCWLYGGIDPDIFLSRL